ncbi:MAG: hypothetical protein PHU36_09110 [Syntrophomonadaceae bacterium]|nr:hypothetical protein [Syntrophomonadaceae bacterium]
MDTPKKDGVPKILPVLIVVIFAVMYYFAAFYPTTGPEKTVEKFYASYIDKDYQGMAESVSVFWAVQFLPQHSSEKPSELIAKRETIEKETVAYLAEAPTETQNDLRVEVLPEYTKEWENTAMVVYASFKGEEELGKEVALMLKENNNYYLYMWIPLESDAVLEETQTTFEKFDADYTKALLNDEW